MTVCVCVCAADMRQLMITETPVHRTCLHEKKSSVCTRNSCMYVLMYYSVFSVRTAVSNHIMCSTAGLKHKNLVLIRCAHCDVARERVCH